MKYFVGFLAVFLVLGLVSAKPQPAADFGERVRGVLRSKGITIEKVLAGQEGIFNSEQVGDIWTNCGSSGDIGTIEKVTITPDPPQKGANLTVDASIKLSETVSTGNLAVKLQYYVLGFPITVVDTTFPLCGSETGLNCPLAAGEQSVKFANEVPPDAPAGKYTGNAVATSSGGKQILCIDLEFSF